MENFEAFLLGIGCAIVIVMSAVLIVVLIILFRTALMLNQANSDTTDCDHRNSQYDEGHPDFPWKCNDCGKRH